MTTEKFKSEVETLQKFFSIYCKDKHQNQIKRDYIITYKDLTLNFSVELCDECNDLLNYAIQRLKECPHDPKPRCRKCPNPCYEKDKYKQMAKMMRYSGFKLGLTKAAKKLHSIFKSS